MTYGLEVRCSIQLSYGRTKDMIFQKLKFCNIISNKKNFFHNFIQPILILLGTLTAYY